MANNREDEDEEKKKTTPAWVWIVLVVVVVVVAVVVVVVVNSGNPGSDDRPSSVDWEKELYESNQRNKKKIEITDRQLQKKLAEQHQTTVFLEKGIKKLTDPTYKTKKLGKIYGNR